MGMVNVEITLTCVVKNAERVRFILGNAVKNEITCDDSPVLLLFLAPSKKKEFLTGSSLSTFAGNITHCSQKNSIKQQKQ